MGRWKAVLARVGSEKASVPYRWSLECGPGLQLVDSINLGRRGGHPWEEKGKHRLRPMATR